MKPPLVQKYKFCKYLSALALDHLIKLPISMPIPKNKGVGLDSVKYAAGRIDDEVKFTDDACQMLVKVPRPFLNTILKACVKWAKENNVTLITEKEMQIINDKRSKEKNK